MRLEDSRVLVGIMLAIIISSTTLSILVENQNDEKFSNPIPDEQNLNFTSQKSNATLTLTDIDSPNIIDFSADAQNTCLFNSNDELFCWGRGDEGLLTSGTNRIPTLVSTGTEALNKTSFALNHACALTGNGRVYCWGDNAHGRTGIGLTTGSPDTNTPTYVDTNGIAVDISVGASHSCALIINNQISCWGYATYNRNGFGLNSGHVPNNITIMPSGKNATAISAGLEYTCAILNDNSVFCWGGGNNAGALVTTAGKSYGFGNRTPISISTGYSMICVLLDNHSVNCWGDNYYGQLGTNSTVDNYNPTYVDLGIGRTAKSIHVGSHHACAVLDDDSLKCWGRNGNGQLGTGDNINRLVPTDIEVPLGRVVKSVDLGFQHTCLLFIDSTISCVGDNSYKQLGINSGINEFTQLLSGISTPVRLEEVTEGISVNATLRSNRVVEFPNNDFNYSMELPVGLTFNNSTFIISGIPQYTNQVNWNFSIGNGSVYYNGTYQLQVLSDTDGDGIANKYDNNDDNDPWFDELDGCPIIFGNSTWDVFGCVDSDGDGYSDQGDKFPQDSSQQLDSDQDGYGDNTEGNLGDDCPRTYGTSNRNSTFGCEDLDFDGWADFEDEYANDSSQWKDTDRDSYGDELNGFQGDACPKLAGNSTKDRFGCLDTDGDGWSDNGDALPENPTQWIDRDGDGYGENNTEGATEVDLFPSDGTQWNDTDGDGHGDNPYGTQGDWFPDDPTRWRDSDQDSTADEDDAFPNDSTQQVDSDGDGYGDNIDGNRGDVFPNDPAEWKDSDGDGLGDNADMFPYDPTQIEDRDGDGMGDNPMGIGADKFPDDPTQWGDIDGDGYGDNQLGNNPDLFITDATQWADRDGDGYGDNPQGRLYDMFPDNPTQWEDADEDGLGDNQSGTDADPFLNDFDNDGFNDSIDILPKLASPGDLDADGCLDEVDAFPENGQECVDTDGDGIGDNGDSDDDGDGWTDADEERLGTDSLSASSKPVDSFEIVIPGTAVGLGAWDLIGIFGGVPLFAWISFGFATRNGRCARYEELLKEATSRDELEQIALRWEYSLMLRMLGPHQGIRLERLRAELDDKFENATYEEQPIGVDQTGLVENDGKEIPPINDALSSPSKDVQATSVDDSGYEWLNQGAENYYRPENSQEEWVKFDD